MKIAYRKRHSQSYYAFVVLMCLLICRQSLVTYIIAFLKKIPILSYFSSFTILTAYIVFTVLAYKKSIWRFTRYRDLLVVFFVGISIFWTFVFYPENMQYLRYNFFSYIIYCIPAFFIGLCSIEYDEDMFETISKVSCIAIVASYFLLLYYGSLGMVMFDELGQSYAVLPNTLFVLAYFFYSKKKFYLWFSILGVGYALVLGSRGPLILILVFITLCTIYQNRKKFPVILLIALGVYLFITLGLYKILLLEINSLLRQYGFSTRIIDLALSGEVISHTSGRSDIYIRLLDLLKNRPFLGYGLFGEWQFINWNAHQLYLEVVFEYGWPIGIVLILLYVIEIIRALVTTYKNKIVFYFIMIFTVYVLIQGFMSYSHLRPELFLLLGFSLAQVRKCRVNKFNNDNKKG